MNTDNKIVHGLWIGKQLSAIEILTLKSFLFHGHEFHLWTYARLETPLPPGVILQDANDILPEKHVFRYKNESTFGHGKGSLAGFSDIFRYKLLYDKGGWWVDMDITCLKPLDMPEPYVFRTHDILAVVGNVMKSPKGSPVMKACFEEALETVTQYNTDWLKPVVILNTQIEKFALSKYIKPNISNPDICEIVDQLRHLPVEVDKEYYVIHWMNEAYRHKQIDKNCTVENSFLDTQMQRYSIATQRLRAGASNTQAMFPTKKCNT